MKGSFVTCFFASGLVELELQNVAHKISETRNETLTTPSMYRTMYSSSFNKFYPFIVQCEDICDRYCIQKKNTHYYQLHPQFAILVFKIKSSSC